MDVISRRAFQAEMIGRPRETIVTESSRDVRPPRKVALIGHQAFAMINFRTPMIVELQKLGVELFALSPGMTDLDREALRAIGAIPVDYTLNRTGVSPIQDLMSIAQLVSRLRQIQPDLVLSFTTKPVIFGTLAAWLSGVPLRYCLIEGLGRVFVDAPGDRHLFLRFFVSGLYRFALSLATRTLFLNHDDMAEFTGHLVVSANTAEVIGGIGVDLEFWRQSPPPHDPVTFLFASRLLREKGVLDFIEAARRVRSQFPAARFVVLGGTEKGGGISDDQMQRAVDDGLIEWPGHVSVLPWLQKASVFVLPSYYREGVPRSIQEALAVGRAVITTDTPGCRETVVMGESGFLVAPRDPGALASAMMAFVRDPSLIVRMGQRGRELAEERFDVHSATSRSLAAMGF